MQREFIPMSEDGQIHLTAYLHEYSGEMPLWRRRPAVLVFPGGGYARTSDREADPIALAFLAQGFHAFVLRYSVGLDARFPNSLRDASRAIKMIRERAEEWGIAPDQIAVCGFSAGGHLAASLGTLWNDPEVMKAVGVAEGENRPNALILGYPVISALNHSDKDWFKVVTEGYPREEIIARLSCERNVGPQTPPTFLFHTYDDNVVPVENSLLFAQALAQADIPFEMHIFQRGVHGISLANILSTSGSASQVDADAEKWFSLATAWLWRLFGTPTPTAAPPEAAPRAHF